MLYILCLGMEFGGSPNLVVNGRCSFTAAYLEKKVAVCLLIDACWFGCT
jgi:hypothetical protein